jgi:hypothetical protein
MRACARMQLEVQMRRLPFVDAALKMAALKEIAARQCAADEKRKTDAERQARSSGGHFLSPMVQ